MLDVLLELILDAVTGKQPKQAQKAQPRRRTASPSATGGAERPVSQREQRALDEAEAEARRDAPPPRHMTLEDMIRRMAGEEAEPEPPPRRRSAPPARAPEPPPPPPRAPAAPARSLVSRTLDALEKDQPLVPAAPKRSASAYAETLRSNPRAARDAFVYGEIFGKPLAERDSHF